MKDIKTSIINNERRFFKKLMLETCKGKQLSKIALIPRSINILNTPSDNNREHGRLPMELVCNILLQLPVEDLLRCKCVCKCWRDEINSLNFINSHTRLMKNSNEANTSKSSLILVFSRGLKTLTSFDFHSPENTKVRSIIPNISHCDSPFLVGSCTGLLCFAQMEYIDLTRKKRARIFSLYNPITGASKLVPQFEPRNLTLRKMGFGYDCTSEDYKILFLALKKENLKTYSGLYTLKSNSWKINMDEPCPFDIIGPLSSMVLSNNALHFITLSNKLIGFDLGREGFHEVPLPSDQRISYDVRIELANLRGCLHLVRLTEIWIMKEYGVQQSWIKLFCFSQANECALFDRNILGKEWMIPCAYSEDGKEILVAIGIHNWFFRLDLQSLEFKRLEFSNLPKDWEFWAYSAYAIPWVGSFVYP